MASHFYTKLPFPAFDCAPVHADGNNKYLQDGNVVVCGGGGSSKSGIQNAIVLYQGELVQGGALQAMEQAQYLTGSELPKQVEVSPNGQFVAATIDGSTLLLEYIPDRNIFVKAAQFDTVKKIGDDMPLQAVVRFSPDSSMLATAGNDNEIKIWQIDMGPVEYDLPPEEKETETVSKEGKGKELKVEKETAKANTQEHSTERIQIRRVDLLKRFSSGPDEVRQLMFHPYGEILASVAESGVRLWEAKSGTFKQLLPCDKSRDLKYRDCMFVGPNALVTLQIPKRSRSHSYLVLWKMEEYSIEKKWSLTKIGRAANVFPATCLNVSKSGRYLIVGNADGGINIVKFSNFKVIKSLKKVHNFPVTSSCFITARSKAKQQEMAFSASADKVCTIIPIVPIEQGAGCCCKCIRFLVLLLILLFGTIAGYGYLTFPDVQVAVLEARFGDATTAFFSDIQDTDEWEDALEVVTDTWKNSVPSEMREMVDNVVNVSQVLQHLNFEDDEVENENVAEQNNEEVVEELNDKPVPEESEPTDMKQEGEEEIEEEDFYAYEEEDEEEADV